MNSMSRGYNQNCGKEKRREEEKEYCPTIIKCGCPGAVTIPTTAEVGNTFTIASLTLDNSCLCDPITRLEFTSNVIASEGTEVGAFNIQVFKQYRNQVNAIPVGPSWSYSTTTGPSSQTFSFFICDSDSCYNECCTYTVVATVVTVPGGAAININNATLGAITTCKSNACSRKCEKNY